MSTFKMLRSRLHDLLHLVIAVISREPSSQPFPVQVAWMCRLSVAGNTDQYCAKRAEERHSGISLAANERGVLVSARSCLMVILEKKPAYDGIAALSDLESKISEKGKCRDLLLLGTLCILAYC